MDMITISVVRTLSRNMSLEDQALQRRARLHELKQKRLDSRNRNYDVELQAAVKGSQKPEVLQNPTAEDIGAKVEEDILAEFDRRAQLATGKTKQEKVKHDEHLKEHLEPYLSKARTQTDRAVYEIVRERYESEAEGSSDEVQ